MNVYILIPEGNVEVVDEERRDEVDALARAYKASAAKVCPGADVPTGSLVEARNRRVRCRERERCFVHLLAISTSHRR